MTRDHSKRARLKYGAPQHARAGTKSRLGAACHSPLTDRSCHSLSAIRSRFDLTGSHPCTPTRGQQCAHDNERRKGHGKGSAGGGGARTTAHRKTNQVDVQHFRALRKQVWRPQRNQSRWGDQACPLRVAVTRDARARGRAGCGAGHRQSSAHRRWQNCGGRPLENPFERFALIPIYAPKIR